MNTNDLTNKLKFDEKGLIPVIAQDCKTDEVLMLAYMNAESLRKTIEGGKACYWSRSRQKLWLKGETSGHYQLVRSISIDCDSDTLLLKVEQTGAACHTGHHSCFYTKLEADSLKAGSEAKTDANVNLENALVAEECAKYETTDSQVLEELFGVISDRAANPKEGSYTNYLFTKGLDKILKKVGEETAEVLIAAKNESADELKNEVADLFYHVMVLLVQKGMKLEEIYEILKERR